LAVGIDLTGRGMMSWSDQMLYVGTSDVVVLDRQGRPGG
jgi:hypothetical protein